MVQSTSAPLKNIHAKDPVVGQMILEMNSDLSQQHFQTSNFLEWDLDSLDYFEAWKMASIEAFLQTNKDKQLVLKNLYGRTAVQGYLTAFAECNSIKQLTIRDLQCLL